MTLELEVGKIYVDGYGGKVKILKGNSGCFEGNDGWSYGFDGTAYSDEYGVPLSEGELPRCHLIAEAPKNA